MSDLDEAVREMNDNQRQTIIAQHVEIDKLRAANAGLLLALSEILNESITPGTPDPKHEDFKRIDDWCNRTNALLERMKGGS